MLPVGAEGGNPRIGSTAGNKLVQRRLIKPDGGDFHHISRLPGRNPTAEAIAALPGFDDQPDPDGDDADRLELLDRLGERPPDLRLAEPGCSSTRTVTTTSRWGLLQPAFPAIGAIVIWPDCTHHLARVIRDPFFGEVEDDE